MDNDPDYRDDSQSDGEKPRPIGPEQYPAEAVEGSESEYGEKD